MNSGDGPTPARDLTAHSVVRSLLAEHGLRPDRDLGQNFLVDRSALTAIVAAADIEPSDTVLEIGPGLGVLSVELARAASRVVSVELDRRLAPVLARTLAGFDNIEVVFEDALAFDFGRMPPGSLLVANLPYNVATPVVARALEAARFSRLVFLVQREVAQRMSARAGTPEYGALSLLVQYFGRARTVRNVPPGAFHPPPEITSSVVRIDVDVQRRADPGLFKLVRQAFAHRRKTLRKNLVMAGHEEERVVAALDGAGLDHRVRAEALGLSEFEALRDRLHTAGLSPS